MAAILAAAGAVSAAGQSSKTESKSRRRESSQLPAAGAGRGNGRTRRARRAEGQRDTFGTVRAAGSCVWKLVRPEQASTWTITTRFPGAASSAAIPLQASGPRDPGPLSTTATTEWLWKRRRMRSRYSPGRGAAASVSVSAGEVPGLSRIQEFVLRYAPSMRSLFQSP